MKNHKELILAEWQCLVLEVEEQKRCKKAERMEIFILYLQDD